MMHYGRFIIAEGSEFDSAAGFHMHAAVISLATAQGNAVF